MPSEWTNILGAVVIACAALISHPMSNAESSRLEERFAFDWNAMSQQQGCADLGSGACLFLQNGPGQF
jgi:hypothetical protein